MWSKMEMSFTSGSMFEKIRSIGALRLMLMGTALAFAAMMPMAHLPNYSGDWSLLFNGVVPAMAPLLVIVQLMDITMANVWKDEDEPEEVARLDFVIRSHLITGGILLAAFMTIFLQVLLP